ncbi:MAG: archaeosine biosynthesis radical SAM protein RaSEA [Candidatus Thermoplasmatota archaeon]
MEEISSFCRKIKTKFRKDNKIDLSEPVGCWGEKDVFRKRIVDAFVIILRTRGCSWALKSGCTMCGYFNDSAFENISDRNLIKQFDKCMKKFSGQKIVKIFTSGSFLDESEITEKVRNHIIKILSEKTEKISFESRPEYVNYEELKKINSLSDKAIIEVSLGLETSDDTIRSQNINKGFSFKDYKKTVDIIKKQNMNLKTYVLVKPPFLSEKKSIKDSVNTIKKINNLTDIISLNPVNVQKNTLVEYLWKRKQYRPPWLWSIIEILKNADKKCDENTLLKCDIAGGGKIRGSHNCGECDQELLKSIKNYSLKQNISELKNIYCSCKEKWKDQKAIEDLSFGSIIDIE